MLVVIGDAAQFTGIPPASPISLLIFERPTMLEVMQFIFSSFWVWLGTVILAVAIAEGLGAFIRNFTQK